MSLLASFVIVSYNQEAWIGAAVRGALAQTYAPLEIVISDDSSTDGTWEAIQEAVRGYRGPHKVTTRRTQENVGLAEHLNQAWRACNGCWIFSAAGDDVSHPNRVARTMALVAQNPRARAAQSWLNEVDSAGHLLSVNRVGTNLSFGAVASFGIADRLAGRSPHQHGAALAYSRELVDAFEPLPRAAVYEDGVLWVRAHLLGETLVIAEPLVGHRNHEQQITRTWGDADAVSVRSRLVTRATAGEASIEQSLRDIERVRDVLHPDVLAEARSIFRRWLRHARLKRRALSSPWPLRSAYLLPAILQISGTVGMSRAEILASSVPASVFRLLKGLTHARPWRG